MTPEEFEKKLQELIQAAPEGTTMFTIYSNQKNKRPNIFFMQGNPIDIICDLSLFAKKEEHAKRILTTAVMALKLH